MKKKWTSVLITKQCLDYVIFMIFMIQFICKHLHLQVRIGEKDIKGLHAYQYKFMEDELDNGVNNTENKCFCRQGRCLQPGLIDVTDCYYGECIYHDEFIVSTTKTSWIIIENQMWEFAIGIIVDPYSFLGKHCHCILTIIMTLIIPSGKFINHLLCLCIIFKNV